MDNYDPLGWREREREKQKMPHLHLLHCFSTKHGPVRASAAAIRSHICSPCWNTQEQDGASMILWFALILVLPIYFLLLSLFRCGTFKGCLMQDLCCWFSCLGSWPSRPWLCMQLPSGQLRWQLTRPGSGSRCSKVICNYNRCFGPPPAQQLKIVHAACSAAALFGIIRDCVYNLTLHGLGLSGWFRSKFQLCKHTSRKSRWFMVKWLLALLPGLRG